MSNEINHNQLPVNNDHDKFKAPHKDTTHKNMIAEWKTYSKKKKNVVKIMVGIVIVIGILVAMLNSNTHTPTPVSSVNNTTPAQNSTPKPAKTAPAKPLSTIDSLWIAADKSLKSRKNINISYDSTDPKDKVVFIDHTDANPFDSQSFIRQSYTILALYGQEAFKVKGVDSINVQNKTDFTDQYGNKKRETGVTIDMHKADFAKFNWKNLENLPVSEQIQDASDVYIVKPALEPFTADQLFLTFDYNP